MYELGVEGRGLTALCEVSHRRLEAAGGRRMVDVCEYMVVMLLEPYHCEYKCAGVRQSRGRKAEQPRGMLP